MHERNNMLTTDVNILEAFYNIVKNPNATINPARISSNRINNVGDALEGYVKDLVVGLADTNVSDIERDQLYSNAFSWLGNKGNPPDSIIRGGDAIEVKKIETLNSDLQLNSSYPKNKLHSDDTRISNGARNAEVWSTKDIIYAVGSVKNNSEIERLWFIYGDCYSASREVYERLVSAVSNVVRATPDVEFHETNELGRVQKVDPLGITHLRIRGMWIILNPSILYSNLVKKTENKQFYLLMRENKYATFPITSRKKIESLTENGFSAESVEIRDPDNPAILLKARFLKYEI